MSPSPQTGQSGNTAAMSTLEFYRQLFAPRPKPGPEALRPLRRGQPHLLIPGGLTVEEYRDRLAAAKAAGADREGQPRRDNRIPGLLDSSRADTWTMSRP